MRTLLIAGAFLAVAAAAASAEPPPQAAVASAPAVTVADARALPAVMVTQVDTSSRAASSETTRVDTTRVDTVTQATKTEGHGMGFWLALAAIALIVIAAVLAWRYSKKSDPPYTVADSEQGDTHRTRTPGSSGRRSDLG